MFFHYLIHLVNSYTTFKTQLRHHLSCHSRLLFQIRAPTAPCPENHPTFSCLGVRLPTLGIVQDCVWLVSVAPGANAGPGPPRSAPVKDMKESFGFGRSGVQLLVELRFIRDQLGGPLPRQL